MSHIVHHSAQIAGLADPSRVQSLGRDAALGIQPPLQELLSQLDETQFLASLAAQLGLAWTENPLPPIDARGELARICGPSLALRYRFLPMGLEGKTILLGCSDPFDLVARQVANRELARPIRWILTPRQKLIEGLQTFYGVGADTFEEILAGRDEHLDDGEKEEANVLDGDDEEASVVKFVNEIMRDALAQRATDIHLEPLVDSLRIRYRIDGMLDEIAVPENIRALQASVIARIKVMARLDIAEKRLPQDGRIALQLDGQSIDVRVATVPSVEGESVSLRLLGQETFTIERLGMLPDHEKMIRDLIAQPNGIVMVTGPTGCGKSTSLYSFLCELNDGSQRIVTVEDPVENKLPGVVQIAVKPEIDLTFASGLRSILRADPNVIMIGEIRDLETAEIAIRSALTGHLVFSTLHTNDALGGISRLVDMGVEPFLVCSSVRAFIAQRLVRKLCKSCKQPISAPIREIEALGYDLPLGAQFFAPKAGGCDDCRHSGFRGRTAIYEICRLTPKLQELVTSGASISALSAQARADGFTTMREYGWRKVIAGETTLEEVLAVTAEEEGG